MYRKRFWVVLALVAFCLVAANCGGGADPPAPTAAPVAVGFTPQPVCKVPNVVGLDQAAAERMLAELGLQPVKGSAFDASVAAGTVISQKPAADTRVEPCQGDVDVVVSLGAPPVPTDTPLPTNTPEPPTPTPTNTPLPPTATPTPDLRLFSDDFEEGIKPDWHMTGNGYASTNGVLRVGGLLESGIVGDKTWDNYAVTVDDFGLTGCCTTDSFRVRAQDASNYMLLKCFEDNADWAANCQWKKVIDGKEQDIPGAGFGIETHGIYRLRIEVEGQQYRAFIDGQPQVRFADDTFGNGGIGIRIEPGGQMGGFEVTKLLPEQ